MMVGKTSGAMYSAWKNPLARRPLRTVASAAITPSTVATLEANSASSTLSVKAPRICSREKKSANQRSEKPVGGN